MMKKSHNILVKTLHLQEEKYSSKELKELSDKDNPLQPVNQLHGLMKRFRQCMEAMKESIYKIG